MVKNRRGHFYINKELEPKIKENFGTTDIKELEKIVLDILTNGTENKEFLPAKERKEEALAQIAQAKAERIKEKENEKLHKLHLENEILERHLSYSHTFNSEPSSQANSAMKKGINQKYSNYGQPNYGQPNIIESIQKKKNFFINKIKDGEYCGVCKVCQNFTTDICITSHEAEGDIELHLESLHNLELYQR